MSKYYIRDTEFEFNTLADARKKAKELSEKFENDVVICLKDTDAVKDIYPAKTISKENSTKEESPLKSPSNIDNGNNKPSSKFYVELTDKYTHIKSFLSEGMLPYKASYNSYGEAVKAAEDFLKLTNSSTTFSYLIRADL